MSSWPAVVDSRQMIDGGLAFEPFLAQHLSGDVVEEADGMLHGLFSAGEVMCGYAIEAGVGVVVSKAEVGCFIRVLHGLLEKADADLGKWRADLAGCTRKGMNLFGQLQSSGAGG